MSSNDPRVSVVVRTCPDRRGWLCEALRAINAQSYQPIEVVVVEDGAESPADGLADLVSGPQRQLVHRVIPKSGRCRAGNVGLQAASGTYLQFLDDDDLLFPNHLRTLIDALRGSPSRHVAYSVALEAPTRVASRAPLAYREIDRYVAYRQRFSSALLRKTNYLPIQSVLFHRSLFDDCGGLDESLDNLEDWDLWRRYAGCAEFLFVDRVTSLYRVPGDPDEAARRRLRLDDWRSSCLAAVSGQTAVASGSGMSERLRRGMKRAVLTRPWVHRCYWHARRRYYRLRHNAVVRDMAGMHF
jgi:glycosyltransferase involved in cell wall biosynthesis